MRSYPEGRCSPSAGPFDFRLTDQTPDFGCDFIGSTAWLSVWGPSYLIRIVLCASRRQSVDACSALTINKILANRSRPFAALNRFDYLLSADAESKRPHNRSQDSSYCLILVVGHLNRYLITYNLRLRG